MAFDLHYRTSLGGRRGVVVGVFIGLCGYRAWINGLKPRVLWATSDNREGIPMGWEATSYNSVGMAAEQAMKHNNYNGTMLVGVVYED